MKIKNKILVSAMSSILLLCSFVPSVTHAGDYDGVSTTSIIASAYQDAQINIAKKDADKEGADGDKAGEAGNDVEKAKASLSENLGKILSSGNFGIIGVLFGPTSAVASDNYANLQNTMSVNIDGLRVLDSAGGNGKAMAYHSFGRAISHLQNDNIGRDVTALKMTDSVNAFSKTATSFSLAGVRLVKTYNPAPFLYSFFDSSYLSNSMFAGENGNELVKYINKTDVLKQTVKFFGDPTKFGVSTGFLIVFLIAFVNLVFAVLQRAWNNKGSAQSFRKLILKVFVYGIGIPFMAWAFSTSINSLSDTLEDTTRKSNNVILRQNLNLLDWYQNSSFGLPQGMALQVKKGKFQFTEDQVEAINRFSSTSQGNHNSKSDKEIIDRMISMGETNGNLANVSFRASYGEHQNVGDKPWDTGKIYKIAEKFAKNEALPEKIDIGSIEYFKGGLQARGGGDTYTYTMISPGYGISPIGSFNMLATDFNDNGLTVRSNASQAKTVSVAIDVTNTGADASGDQAPVLIKFLCILTLLYSGIKALINILVGGFGGAFQGGFRSAFGNIVGIGQLAGSLFAFTVGLVGLSVLMLFLLNSIDLIYHFLNKLVDSDNDGSAVSAIYDGIKSFGAPISWFASLFKSFGQFILNILVLLFLWKAIPIPLDAYGNWLKNLPNTIASKFGRWGDSFTSSYGSPSSGGFGNNTTIQKGLSNVFGKEGREKAISQGKGLIVGSAMMGGALASYIGYKMTNESLSDVANNSESIAGDDLIKEDVNSDLDSFDDTSVENTETTDILTEDEFNEFDSIAQTVETDENNEQGSEGVQDLRDKESVSEQLDDSDNVAVAKPISDELSREHVEEPVSDTLNEPVEQPVSDIANQSVNESSIQQPTGDQLVDNSSEVISDNVEYNKDGNIISNEVNNRGGETAISSNNSKLDSKSTIGGTNVNSDNDMMVNSSLGGVANTIKNDANKTDVNNNRSNVNSVSNAELKNTSETSMSSKADTTINDNSKQSSIASKVKESTLGKTTNAKGEEMSKARLGIGRALQSLGGYAHGDHQGKKQFMAGLGHMAGSVVGAQAHTGKLAQKQINNRNDRLVSAGHTVKSNLTADVRQRGMTREQINSQAIQRVRNKDNITKPSKLTKHDGFNRNRGDKKPQRKTFDSSRNTSINTSMKSSSKETSKFKSTERIKRD